MTARAKRFGVSVAQVTAWGSLAAVFLLYALPLAMESGLIFGADTITFVYPLRAFSFRWVQEGIVPLWNPHIYGGTPNLAGLQSALFYVPNGLYFLLGPTAATNLLIYLHWAMHLAGFYVLGRKLGLGRPGAALTASLATFNVCQMSRLHAGHLTPQAVMAWSPWAALLLLGTLRGRWATSAAFGFVVAMQLLGGHPQYFYYSAWLYVAITVASLVAWRMGTALVPGASPGRWQQAAAGLALSVAVFLGATAAQALPTMELLDHAHRAQSRDLSYFGKDAMTWQHLPMLLFPHLFGDQVEDQFILGGSFWELSGSIGLLGTLLAVLAMALPQARPQKILWALSAVGALLLAFGPNLPGFEALFRFVPGMGGFRALSRILWLWSFAVSILAGWGLHGLLASERKRVPVAAWGSLVAVSLIVVALPALGAQRWLYRALPERGEVMIAGLQFTMNAQAQGEALVERYRARYHGAYAETLAVLGFFAALLGAWRTPWRPVVAMGAIPLAVGFAYAQTQGFLYKKPLYTFYQNEASAAFIERDHRAPRCLAQWSYQALNTGMLWGFENIGGANDPLLLSSFARWANRNENQAPDAMRDAAVFTQFPARLGEMGTRYYLFTEADWAGRGNLALRFRQGEHVVLEDTSAPPRIERTAVPAEIPSYVMTSPNEVILTPETAGTHLIRDMWYPGWKIRTREGDLPLQPHDDLHRLAELPAGEVRMVYEPFSYRLGLFISLTAILIFMVKITLETAALGFRARR